MSLKDRIKLDAKGKKKINLKLVNGDEISGTEFAVVDDVIRLKENDIQKYVLMGSILWYSFPKMKEEFFLDRKDGKNYKTIQVGNTIWLAEDYGLYDKKLYTFDEAKSNCPIGWKIPSSDEWKELMTFITGEDYSSTFWGFTDKKILEILKTQKKVAFNISSSEEETNRWWIKDYEAGLFIAKNKLDEDILCAVRYVKEIK